MIAVDTKQRILDSAEKLFANQGLDTSLRTIIADAQVNLAAIHYHYHSKEALLDAVLARRLKLINEERIEKLELCGPKATLEGVLEAFIAPAVRVAADPAGGRNFVRLMGRIVVEDRLPGLIKQHFGAILQRFTIALQKAVPELPPVELFWRMHFTAGVMAHTLRAGLDMELISNGVCDPTDVDSVTQRVVAYAAAGFRAPVPPGANHA